jgi:hypothetical protein
MQMSLYTEGDSEYRYSVYDPCQPPRETSRQAGKLKKCGAIIANLVGSQSIIQTFPSEAALDDSAIASVDAKFVKRYGSCPRRLLRRLDLGVAMSMLRTIQRLKDLLITKLTTHGFPRSSGAATRYVGTGPTLFAFLEVVEQSVSWVLLPH